MREDMIIEKCGALRGAVEVPGDKSISHRSIMLGAIAGGDTRVTGFLKSADCLSTIDCFRRMGIGIDMDETQVIIHGRGLHGANAPSQVLNAGNSGTTTRLISGILAGQPFTSVIDGDASLRKRPMKRIITPLSMMGARFESTDGCLPMTIRGGSLKGIRYAMPVASAQVKSAILLAGLYADGPTTVIEPAPSRNHTELMLGAFGADLTAAGREITVMPSPSLTAQEIAVPGDISSAAFFIAAGLIVPGSEITIRNVGLNPTRDGILRVCRMMGADIRIENRRLEGGEPVADLTVREQALTGTQIDGDLIPTLIDEIPVIAVMACFAKGTTVIRDAAELKVKESDRIMVMADNLSAMGADITPTEDGFIIRGGRALHGAVIDPHQDHRIAMALSVAGLMCRDTRILDSSCVSISYPTFFDDLKALGAGI